MIESGKIAIKTKEGETIECDVLFTFESEETNKKYIVYTDNTLDELGSVKVYANTYESEKEGLLGEIETKKEWDIIEQIFSSINSEKEGK